MSPDRGGGDQLAYSMWIPRDADRALCIAYGGRVSASLLARLAHEVQTDGPENGPASFDIVMLIGHPAGGSTTNRERALTEYLEKMSLAWTMLKPTGRLIVALDPSMARNGMTSGVVGWLHPRTWLDARTVGDAIRALRASSLLRIHVFPSVWRPVLLHTPESPVRLKRLALSHTGGWRAGSLARVLLGGGRFSVLDLCPAGIVWIAQR